MVDAATGQDAVVVPPAATAAVAVAAAGLLLLPLPHIGGGRTCTLALRAMAPHMLKCCQLRCNCSIC